MKTNYRIIEKKGSVSGSVFYIQKRVGFLGIKWWRFEKRRHAETKKLQRQWYGTYGIAKMAVDRLTEKVEYIVR